MADAGIPDVIPLDQFTADPAASAAARSPATAALLDSIPLDQFQSDDEKNESLSENVKGAAEGAASALSFGTSTGLEKSLLGVKDADINRRRDTIGHAVGTGLALAAPLLTGNPVGALGVAADIGKGAEVASEALGAGKILKGAANEAVQMGLLQLGDETSKMISDDPGQTLASAMADVGFAGLTGGVFGGGVGLVGKGIESGVEKLKLNDFVADFKGALSHAVHNPDPVGGLTEELGQYYKATDSVANDVYGATGLKAQEIKALAPEVNPKMFTQAQEVLEKTNGVLKRLGDDPLARNLAEAAQEYQGAITKPGATGAELFEAGNTFKKQVGEWARYDKDFHPLGERAFRNGAKDVASTLKGALEDTAVWGKAGERQSSVNKAFSEYLPALKDFRSKFMSKVAGDFEIDPGKISSYLKGIGSPRAELKQEMLGNFLKASEKYRGAIADTHANLKLPIPFESTPLNLAKGSLKEVTLGKKLADQLVEKGLGKVAGGAIGGAIGNAVGHPFLGAYVGEKALGSYINSILPALLKPISSSVADGAAAKVASAFGMAALKGQKIMGTAADALFKPGAMAAISHLRAENIDTDKIRKWADTAANNPRSLEKLGDSKLGHYMPAAQVALGQKAAQVANYLQTQKPQEHQQGLFGKTVPPSKAQESAYTRTLSIAQQPLSLIGRIHTGTLTLKDVQDVKTMHPDIYQALSQKLISSLTEASAKEQPVPYKMRQSLTLFLGHSVDPTLEPAAIAAAQAVHKAQPQQEAAQGPSQQPNSRSTKALEKLSSEYRTPGQQRQQDRQNRQ